jgi:DNA-3-methyladenine glycosylase II
MQPEYWQSATRTLARRDSVLKGLIKAYPGLTLRSRGDAFGTLARSIVGQQISVKAADTVWARLAATVPAITPAAIASASPLALRSAGLSARKAEYLQDLARHFISGLIDIEHWRDADDEHIAKSLVQIKGIGPWTAEMFMIFYLMRPNILPVDDIGLQRAMSLHYREGRPLAKSEMREIATSWHPWCSVATWYLWRSLDPVPVEY